MARIFEAPAAYFGPRCVVRGSNRIAFGRKFYAHSDLWLEAVTRYRDQQFSPTIKIGENVSLSKGVHVTCVQSIILGNGVLIGSGVYISDHQHGVYKGGTQSHPSQPPAERLLGGGGDVVIGDNVWIGDNVIILGPVSIGSGAVLAANAVITRDVSSNTIVAGIPAKPIKRFDERLSSWVSI